MSTGRKKYLWAFLLFILMVSLIPAVPCHAASAKVDLSTDNAEVTEGDTVYVYIKINSDTAFGDFEANLTYNDSVLEYTGGASVIKGGNGYLKISDIDVAEKSTSRKYALAFKALKVGDCKLSFSDEVLVYDEAGKVQPVSNNELIVKVKAKNTASANAYLKSLITSPTDITPSFDKKIFQYNVKVSSDTEKLVLSAIPEDEKAIVSTSGNESLKEGENKVIITVLAESGDVIEYTINVLRESASDKPVTDHVTITPTPAAEISEILSGDGENYLVLHGKYKLIEPGSSVQIPVGYTKTVINVAGTSITAFAPSNDPESEFVLIYAENSSGEQGFYQYDRVEQTLQRYHAALAEGSNSNVNNSKAINNGTGVIAVLAVLSALLLFAVIFLLFRLKESKKNGLDD